MSPSIGLMNPNPPVPTVAKVNPPSRLSNADASAYVERGYLVLPGLLQVHEISELRADLIKLARGSYPAKALPVVASTVSDEEALRSILCIHQPHVLSALIAAYMAHPNITRVLGEIVGAHLGSLWDGSVKCMQSMYFAKPPGKPGQAWHQDEAYIPTRDRSLCGAWIALDDANVENGCLSVLPKSHQAGVLYPLHPHSNPEFDASPEACGFAVEGELAVEVRAGSVVFFNGYLLHRSKRNTSSRPRRALVSHYMTGQSLLPWDTELAGEHGLIDNRRIVVVAGNDPYHWKATTPFATEQVYLRAEAAQPQ